jgi:hypothetical protein
MSKGKASMTALWKLLAVLVTVASSAYGQNLESTSPNVQAASSIPKHLELARELVATVKPENNKYVIFRATGVHWKGDLFTSENSVNTACAGLVTGVLEHAKSPSVDKVKSNTQWKHELRTNNYFEAISKELGFNKISKLSDVLPGDIFAFSCKDICSVTDGNENATSDIQGHVTFVDAKPTLKNPTPPLIDGTLQWLLPIIDSSPGPHDMKDTRWRPKGEPRVSGVGRGTIRIYTDPDGVPVGYTAGPNAKKLHIIEDRPIIFGRPQAY